MTDAMNVLYSYAQDYLEKTLLALEPDFAEAQREVQAQAEAFLTLLDDRGRELFDDLLDGQHHLSSFHGQAMFRAGFQIALDLTAK